MARQSAVALVHNYLVSPSYLVRISEEQPSNDVKFRGVVVFGRPDGIDYEVRIEEVLMDPKGILRVGAGAWVDIWDPNLKIGSIEVGDKVEVYGYCYNLNPDGPGISVKAPPHYIKEISPAQFDFSVSVDPSSRTTEQGGSVAFIVKVTLLTSFTQTVSLSLTGQHETMSCSFSPSSGSPTFSSTLTMDTTTSTPVGSYRLTITGSGGGKTHSTVVESRLCSGLTSSLTTLPSLGILTLVSMGSPLHMCTIFCFLPHD